MMGRGAKNLRARSQEIFRHGLNVFILTSTWPRISSCNSRGRQDGNHELLAYYARRGIIVSRADNASLNGNIVTALREA
jgi:hypothetical protein